MTRSFGPFLGPFYSSIVAAVEHDHWRAVAHRVVSSAAWQLTKRSFGAEEYLGDKCPGAAAEIAFAPNSSVTISVRGVPKNCSFDWDNRRYQVRGTVDQANRQENEVAGPQQPLAFEVWTDGDRSPGLCQRWIEELSGSGRDVRAPGERASRPLTIPQFSTDKVLATKNS